MANNTIPAGATKMFEVLSTMTAEQREQMFSTILEAPEGDTFSLATHLSSRLKMPFQLALNFVSFYIGIQQSVQGPDVQLSISNFRKYIESELPAGDWNRFFETLPQIIESKTLRLAALHNAGQFLQNEGEKTFNGSDVIASLVPFQTAENEMSVVLSYQLKISFLHGIRDDFFSITLNEREIEFLKQTLVESQRFGKTLSEAVRNHKLRMLTVQEND